MAGSILEQFAELKSDYEIGKASRYKRAKTGIMTLGSHADYHYRTEAAYFGAMEMAREMTRNNPLVMQGVRRLVANVVGRGFVLDSDSGDKGIDDVNGYRWAEWSRSPEACDDQQELDFHGGEKLTLQHVIIDGDLCSLPNRDGGIQSQEGHRLNTPRNTTKSVVHGVQQDGRRRRLAYWFTKEDIEPWRSVMFRSHGARGCPEIVPFPGVPSAGRGILGTPRTSCSEQPLAPVKVPEGRRADRFSGHESGPVPKSGRADRPDAGERRLSAAPKCHPAPPTLAVTGIPVGIRPVDPILVSPGFSR